MPRTLLRAEGAALAAGALVSSRHERTAASSCSSCSRSLRTSRSSATRAGPRAGAAAYNATHTTLGPLVLGVAGVLSDADLAVQLALIWLAHIGIDRLLGYGLKYPDRFRETHLQRL